MLTGAHAIIYSANADADRAFLRDVLALPNVDAGDGWLIFGLPPSEVAVHPAEGNGKHELYLICDDIEAFVSSMSERGVVCGAVDDRGWGLLTEITLPGGSKLGVYEPRHARPESVSAKKPAKGRAKPKKADEKADKKTKKKADKKAKKKADKKAKKKADKKAKKK